MPAAARTSQRGSLLKYVPGGGGKQVRVYQERDYYTADARALRTTWAALLSERYSWDETWRDLGRFITPRAPRFCVSDRNKGHKRHNNIYNDAATRAVHAMSAGLMAGASSRARPWFAVTTADPELALYHPVKLWLEQVTEILRRGFESNNTYASLHSIYEQLAVFGTACNIVYGDDESLVHHYPAAIGEFCLAQDYKGRVVTVFRRYAMTVREIVDQFGLENCSETVKEAFNGPTAKLEMPVEVIHAIERRKDRDPSRSDSLNMPWRSCWFEAAGKDDDTQVLRESGFQHFPAITPRWQVDGGDVYGGSPGWDALGQVKRLQLSEISMAKAIEYQVEPSLSVPPSFKGRRVAMLPGGQSVVDSLGPHGGIRPSWEVRTDLSHLRADIEQIEGRIDESFFKRVFFMIANSSDTTQRTAEEIFERREEKFTMLGPGYMRIQDETLAPLVRIAFSELLERERLAPGTAIPPIPPELDGHALKIDFVSVLAQALRLSGLIGQDQFLMKLAGVKELYPQVLDRFDPDAWVDSLSGVLVSPKMIVPMEKAQEIRDARNRMEAAERQAAQMNQAADTAKNLAAAPTGGEQTALTDVMRGVTGYA